MAKKSHLSLRSTELQKNRLLWEQYCPTDLGRTAPALKNYFNWYFLKVLIMWHVSADSTWSS